MATKTITIPNITSLRFILAMLVVIFHISEFFQKRGFPYYNNLAVFHKGSEAVYGFFALSGFLIIKQLYIEKKTTGTIALKAFYTRRMLRIFPLYYLILIFGFLYYTIILPKFGFEFESNYNSLHAIILGATFFPNIMATYSPGGILEILWSIGIEEQFYLFVAPTLLLLPVQKITRFLIGFTLLYFAVYFYSGFAFLENYRMLFFYFSFSGFCAIILENQYFKKFIHVFRYLILVAFVLHLTTSLFTIENNAAYHIFNVLLFGFSISALSQKPIAFFENKVLIYLGKISYGIYMYHAIAMQFVGLLYLKVISKFNFNDITVIVLSNLLSIGLTIWVSHISYNYYELYFLKKKYKNNLKAVE